jgi:hypothetical protein
LSVVHGIERAPEERVNWKTSFPFFLVHALVLLSFWTGVTRTAVVIFLVLFWGRMFFITGGYHRYFSHRSYKTNRVFQFILAFGGGAAAQKGALWWASHHRNHHRYSDTELDLHSPQKGFWWSHVGWILCDKNNGWEPDDIRDFNKFPELRFLNKNDWIPPWTVGVACVPHRRLERPGVRLPRLHRAAVALHVLRELAGPRDGPAPLRHHRHQPELRPHRLPHHGRGLAQQPPLLPVVHPPGLLLVGVRRHLLHPQVPELGGCGA